MAEVLSCWRYLSHLMKLESVMEATVKLDLLGTQVLGIREMTSGLFYLDSSASTATASQSFPTFLSSSNNTSSSANSLWHGRLGHTPLSKLKQISSIASSLAQANTFICIICPQAKQTRISFPY
ncbi:hypothetical protein Ancab_040540 [Ancistrocladus abbreviatus]